MLHDKKIEVLLSTYNGENFIAEQLKSLQVQTQNKFVLRCRDDGSTDGTCAAIRRFSENKSWVIFRQEQNVGVVRSFWSLLEEVDEDTDYVAFCDQDDIWHPGKLERAINRLGRIGSDAPALYCGRTRLVDEAGRYIGLGATCKRPVGLENALVQNVAVGCTLVINKKARDVLLKRTPDFEMLKMHDWWIYLVISAFGHVIYDREVYIDYRQHGRNVVGGRVGIWQWKARVQRLMRRNKYGLVEHAREFLRIYSDDLPVEQRALCEAFVRRAGSNSVAERCLYAVAGPIYRQKVVDSLFMRVLMGLGWC